MDITIKLLPNKRFSIQNKCGNLVIMAEHDATQITVGFPEEYEEYSKRVDFLTAKNEGWTEALYVPDLKEYPADFNKNIFTFELPNDVTYAGELRMQFVAYKTDGSMTTVPFEIIPLQVEDGICKYKKSGAKNPDLIVLAVTQSTEALFTAQRALNMANQSDEQSRQAIDTANAADAKSDQAIATADEAKQTAQDAFDTSAAANDKSDQAVATSDEARQLASDAVDSSNAANDKSDNAVATADEAKQIAQDAFDTAATADGKSDYAVTTADEAKALAQTAVATSDDANAKSDQAVAISQDAKQLAEDAVATANRAEDKSNQAVITSDDARQLAQNAFDTASMAEGNSTHAVMTADEARQIAQDANMKSDQAMMTANEAFTQSHEANIFAQNADARSQHAEAVSLDANRKSDEAIASAHDATLRSSEALNNSQRALSNSEHAINRANEAEDIASLAERNSNQALAESGAALQAANDAIRQSDTAVIRAEQAVATANLVNDKATNALVQSQQARDIAFAAEEKADAATETANAAELTAAEAKQTAESADAKADSAILTADSADAKADQAITTADNASAKADQAIDQSNTATGIAESAEQSASQAVSLAEQANSNSESALSIAESAEATADRAEGKIDEAVADIAAFKDEATAAIANKVDKIPGKGLSTEDYTTAEKTKLSGIAAGAEVNVQSDWNMSDTASDTFIKNKPISLPADGGNADTVDGKHAADFATAAQGTKADNAVPNTRKVNGKVLSADVTLVPSDIGAEPAFNKNTAFNKNFGTASGTVCEGNDARLSNARPPTPHTHGNADLVEMAAWAKAANKPAYTAAEVGAVPTGRTVNGKALSADITLTPADIAAVPVTRKVNNKALSADITLTPTDISAEPAFTKNTAFNKNFGTTAGTVCEGNDNRLSNARTPISHASTATTYGAGTPEYYGHVKLSSLGSTSVVSGDSALRYRYETAAANIDLNNYNLEGRYTLYNVPTSGFSNFPANWNTGNQNNNTGYLEVRRFYLTSDVHQTLYKRDTLQRWVRLQTSTGTWTVWTEIDVTATNAVPNTRTVNGKALSSNISITASDITITANANLGNATTLQAALNYIANVFAGTQTVTKLKANNFDTP